MGCGGGGAQKSEGDWSCVSHHQNYTPAHRHFISSKYSFFLSFFSWLFFSLSLSLIPSLSPSLSLPLVPSLSLSLSLLSCLSLLPCLSLCLPLLSLSFSLLTFSLLTFRSLYLLPFLSLSLIQSFPCSAAIVRSNFRRFRGLFLWIFFHATHTHTHPSPQLTVLSLSPSLSLSRPGSYSVCQKGSGLCCVSLCRG